MCAVKRKQIAIKFGANDRPLVTVHAFVGAFAVHLLQVKKGTTIRNQSRHWSVSHVRSGLRATINDIGYQSKQDAIAWAHVINDMGDWDCDDPTTRPHLIDAIRQYRAVVMRLDI